VIELHQYSAVIILTDWDRRGGQLCALIKRNLEGRVSMNYTYRMIFSKRSMVRTIEGLPSWIQSMKNKLEQA